MLKDDADLSKLAFKPKQAIMVIGTAGPLPEKPKESVVFLEDMDDGELALAVSPFFSSSKRRAERPFWALFRLGHRQVSSTSETPATLPLPHKHSGRSLRSTWP